jgi:hypothetical protein
MSADFVTRSPCASTCPEQLRFALPGKCKRFRIYIHVTISDWIFITRDRIRYWKSPHQCGGRYDWLTPEIVNAVTLTSLLLLVLPFPRQKIMTIKLLAFCIVGFFLKGRLPYAATVSGIVSLLIIGKGLLSFVRIRRRLARLVNNHRN